MTGLSTHILDTARGLPAPNVIVRLEHQTGNDWQELGQTRTDADGRARLADDLSPGIYRLTFEVAPYFKSNGASAFFPEISIVFCLEDTRHHHVPLLLSPFGYSTYRGS